MRNDVTVAEAVSMSVGPGTAGFNLETPPTFDSVEDERRYRKQELAVALRLFGKLGFGDGVDITWTAAVILSLDDAK